jgi:hypothetical protein
MNKQLMAAGIGLISKFLILFSFIAIVIGFVLFLNPAFTIEIQRRFYEKINWRIEPISMPKEIRNTRIMGLFLIVAGLLTFVVILRFIK